MKRIYLIVSALCLTTLSNAQIHEANFDAPITDSYLTKSDFRMKQTGSDLVIFSKGHGEWATCTYAFNNADGAKTLSISKKDTIYVRAKAAFTNANNPVLNIGLQDIDGIGPNNEQFNAVNRMTLTNEYQIFKFVVSNWNMTWGDPANPDLGKNMDSTKIAKVVFGPNTGFASQNNKNNLDQTIKTAFAGTIYIDYVSFGAPGTSTTSLPVVTGYTEEFNTLPSLITPASFVTTIKEGALSIVSEGHDEWETIRYTLKNNKVDLTSNKIIEFTASAIPASGYTGAIGVMVVAVDETGKRLEYPGMYTLQSLTSTSKTIQIPISKFANGAENDTVVGSRIAFLDIFINLGFASQPQKNNLAQSVNTAFMGEIKIENIKLGADVSPSAINVFAANNAGLSVFPNPTSANIILDNQFSGSDYAVYNANGVEVINGVFTESNIATETLDKGFYIIKVNKDNQLFTTTFIKQ
jgi:hypothetical protein